MSTIIHLDCGTKVHVTASYSFIVDMMRMYDHDTNLFVDLHDIMGKRVAIFRTGVNAIEEGPGTQTHVPPAR